LNRRLFDFAKREGATLYVVLLAAFSELLHRFTGVTDIAVGSPVANRRRREFEPLIGYFINMIVMRNDLSGDPTYRQLVTRVRATVLDGMEHQDLTLDRVVKKLAPDRDLSRHPLFQTMFVLQNTPPPVLEVAGLTLETVPGAIEPVETIFELTMEWMLGSGRLSGHLQYNSDLFSRQSIARLADHYLRLLGCVLDRPDQPLSTISSLGAEFEWLGRVSVGPRLAEVTACASVPAQFIICAKSWPNAIAVEDSGRTLTYAQLDAWSDRVARGLREKAARSGARVAVLMPRCMEAVVALLGVLKTGAAYIPMDPSLPDERIATILDDAAPNILVTSEDLGAAWSGCRMSTMVLETGGCIPGDLSASPLGDTPGDRDLAYIIYTSGSTGTPKGVQIEHRSFLNYCLGAIETYGLKATDRLLQFGGFSYDGHVEELYPILLCGGTLVLRDDPMLQSLSAFSEGCDRRAISVVSLPTGFWHEWTRALEIGNAIHPSALRLVIVGGEAVQPERIRGWFSQSLDKVRLINSYGPTEATVVTTAVELTKGHGQDFHPPIGRPLPGVQVKVVDAFGRLNPPGVNGELLIGGTCLSRGYLGRDDLTERAFVVDPVDQQRWYRTGDCVRWRSDGLLEFVGRIDAQLKIRGFRVEPGEVEAAIIEHPLVERVGVFPFVTDAGPRLVAYLGLGSGKVDADELRVFLKRRLPDFMIPSRFITLPVLPLNSSGKVARELLPDPHSHQETETVPDVPASENEGRMIRLWRQVLGVEHMARDDDFFALGGDSLSALRLVESVRQEFSVELGLSALFAEPTPARLTAHTEELLAAETSSEGDSAAGKKTSLLGDLEVFAANLQSTSSEGKRLWPLNEGGRGVPFYCWHGLGGWVTSYLRLGRQLAPRPVYGVASAGLLGDEPPEDSIESMAQASLLAIRELQPQGPYLLGGWSMGGWIAVEVAKSLRAAGEETVFLALLDTPMPDQAKTGLHRLDWLGGQIDGVMARAWKGLTKRRINGLLRQYGLADKIDEAFVERMEVIIEAHLKALSAYRPGVYDGAAVYWQAEARGLSRDWYRLFPQLRLEGTVGDHFSMLREPAVADLGAVLREYLNEVDNV